MTIGIGMSFLGTTPKAQLMKEMIEELDVIKIRDFSSANDQVKNRKKLQAAGKDLQRTQLIKDCAPNTQRNP